MTKEYNFSLRDLDNDENLPERYGSGIHQTIEENLEQTVMEVLLENYPKMTDIERTYVYGMSLGCELERARRQQHWRMTERALRFVADNKLGSWIAELVQNAQDQDASELNVVLGDSDDDSEVLLLSFSHDGRIFSGRELLALLTPFGTTKDANPFTIGRFGIGFKYWNRFFSSLVVRTKTNRRSFELHVSPSDPDFLPEMKAEETDFDGVLTEFEFGGKPIRLNEELIGDVEVEDFLGPRIRQSMPLLVKPLTSGFSFSIHDGRAESLLDAKLVATCESISDLIHPVDADGEPILSDLVIEKINSASNETGDVLEDGVLKFNLLCSSFLNLNGELGEAFVNAKFEELVQIFQDGDYQEQLENSKAAYNLAFTSAESRLFVSIVYDKNYLQIEDDKGGYFAKRFVTPSLLNTSDAADEVY